MISVRSVIDRSTLGVLLMHYSPFRSQFVSAIVTFCNHYSSQQTYTTTSGSQILTKLLVLYGVRCFWKSEIRFLVSPDPSNGCKSYRWIRYTEIYTGIRTPNGQVLQPLLLPAHSHHPTGQPDSNQTPSSLWCEIFFKIWNSIFCLIWPTQG